MNILALKYNNLFDFFEGIRSEKLGFYFSFIFHSFILFSAIGLPNFFEPKTIFVPTIIPIEVINVSDVTSISKEIKKTKLKETKQTEIKEKKFNSSDNQEIKKIEIKDKNKIEIKDKNKIEIKDKKNIEIKDKKNIEDLTIKENILSKENIKINEKQLFQIELKKESININLNNFESLPTKKIKPKLKPILKSKNIEESSKSRVIVQNKPKIENIKKTSKSDVVIKSKTKKIIEPDFDKQLATMMKDIRNEKTIQKVENIKKEKKEDIIEQLKETIPKENAKLSISEIDLVLQQLSRCFISPAGAEIKKTMFVKISAKIQKNRRVYENSIRIVDTNISKSSSVYGPITESAMRTLLNPECIPLKLPESKYELWKNLTMKFDYSVMRGN